LIVYWEPSEVETRKPVASLLKSGDRMATAFIRAAEDLAESGILKRGDLVRSGIVVFLNVGVDGYMDAITKLPDEDALRGLISRVRKFLLKKDDTNFARVRNMTYASLKARHDAAAAQAFLAELSKEWKSNDQLREESPKVSYWSGRESWIVVTPELALQSWLYADIFHSSDPQVIEAWEEVKATRSMEATYRAYALSAIVGYVPLIFGLAFVLKLLRKGIVPQAGDIQSFYANWQQDTGIQVPPPGHFLRHLVTGPMREETARRLLAGETISDEDILRDLDSQKADSSST
jgi:hypothetical protein